MDIHLHSESVVNERTGEVAPPSEYVENLRAIERTVTRCDEDIAGLKSEMKKAKEAREQAVAALRSAIREGKVLPLFERDDDDEDDDNTEVQTSAHPED